MFLTKAKVGYCHIATNDKVHQSAPTYANIISVFIRLFLQGSF